MDQTPHLFDDSVHLRLSAGPLYQVVITASEGDIVEEQLREVIARKRGDLKSICRILPAQANRVHIHLGVRRIDDVLAALEGAGFDVEAVVATRERSRSHGCSELKFPGDSARASNL